jgi:xylulokinase
MHGATTIDHDGKVIRPCILWNDTRSYKEAAELDADPIFRRSDRKYRLSQASPRRN